MNKIFEHTHIIKKAINYVKKMPNFFHSLRKMQTKTIFDLTTTNSAEWLKGKDKKFQMMTKM